MITFFTTPKPFIGLNRTTQLNAIRSWKKLSSDCEIIVFDNLIGADDIISELNIINITQVEKHSNEIPLPLVNAMFLKACTISKNSICCYVNSDIILTSKFMEVVLRIHNKLKRRYLLVGQRYDLDIKTELDFTESWESDFLGDYKDKMVIHSPFGSDFFVFPRDLYDQNDIPPLVVGRPGWDNWIIYNGVKIKKIKVVDISDSAFVYHQNHKEAYNSLTSIDSATNVNLNFLPPDEKYNYVLDQTNYHTLNGKIKKRDSMFQLSFLKKVIMGIFRSIGVF